MIVYDKLLYSSKELFDSYLHGKMTLNDTYP